MFCYTIETLECFINVGVLINVVCLKNVVISLFRDQMRKKAALFDMVFKLFEYHSAVRGYHCKKYWQPTEDQTLDFMHGKDNPFDFFAFEVMEQNSGRTVGHLPMKISRATKFLLDGGARIIAKHSSYNYCGHL